MEIPIADIQVPIGRDLRTDIAGLADSISHIGLVNPITVQTAIISEVGEQRDGYSLVAGRHRLEAVKSLGHDKIEAVVIELEDLKLDLVEIDENLVRLDIPVIDQADRMKRRQEIYGALGLTTVHGGDRKSAEYKEKNQDSIMPFCFSDDTAQKIGLTPGSIQRLVYISEHISYNLKAEIRESHLAFEFVNLLKLARIKDHKEQRAAALAYISGEADTITVPKKRAPTKTERQQAAEELAEILVEYIPSDLWPQVGSYLRMDKATVTLAAFRKAQKNK